MTQAQPSSEPDRLGGPEMFDRIAQRYDRMNRLLSLGLDRRWRSRLVEALGPLDAGSRALDIATGTADVALDIARAYPRAAVVGLDPSRGMLSVGEAKVASAGLGERIQLVPGDAQALPFVGDHFQACCVSFGIRNVPDRDEALSEMARVTVPGGVVAVLELSEPREGLVAPFARFHVRKVVPTLGALLAGEREYRYLQQSVAAFPPPSDFAEQMRKAGLVDVVVDRQSFGAAHLYVGRVPAE